ncbi:serine-rich adhesin for platelets [Octopus bimaculoides]|uniref:Uncharacterized protein n=1 Tax=Octopus bimaculoides TaxID=37653 RepID=A0A0L8I5L3_OCTBM|nr:serine-rich adhesin for platelets [Octopus bimaculoides]|eukprot:XP_014790615.1 PREDICTED: serine-rich adhesin for platelets-like [Octopus bimaculoides]
MSLDLPVIHIQNNHMTVCLANNVNPLTGHRTEDLTVTVSPRNDRPLTGHRKKRKIERRTTIGCPLTGHRNKCSVITQETNENGLLRGDSNRESKINARRSCAAANVESVIETVADDSLPIDSFCASTDDQNLTTPDNRLNRRVDSVQSLDNITNLGTTPLVEKIRAKSDRTLDYQRPSINSRLSLCSSGSFRHIESVTVRCQQESLVKQCVSSNDANSHGETINSNKSIAMESIPSRSRRGSINVERGAIPVLLRNASTPIKEYNSPSKYSVESLEPLPLESLSVESLEHQPHFTSVEHSPNKAFKENMESSLMQTKAIIRSLSCRLKQSLRRSKSNLEGSIGAKFKETKASLNSIKLTPSSSPANNSDNKRSKLYSNSSADNIFENSVGNQSEKQWRRSFLRYSKSNSSRDTNRKTYFNLLAPNKFAKNASSSEDIIKGKENNKKHILHANSNLECSNMKEPTIVSSVTCLEASRRSSTVSCGEEIQDEFFIRHSKSKLNAPELTIKRLEDKPSGMGTNREMSRSEKFSRLKISDFNQKDSKPIGASNEMVSDNRSAANCEENQNRTKPILKTNLQRQNRVWKRPTKTRTISDTGSGSSDDNESFAATTTTTMTTTATTTIRTADVTIVTASSPSSSSSTTTATTTTTTKAEISALASRYSNDEINMLTPECSRYLLPSECDGQRKLELRTFMRKDFNSSTDTVVPSSNSFENASDINNKCGNDSSVTFQPQSVETNSKEVMVKYENVSVPTSDRDTGEVSTPKHHVAEDGSNHTKPSEHLQPNGDNDTAAVGKVNKNNDDLEYIALVVVCRQP